ncbi:MAG: DUF3488 and transglutaminase-like domain-containing protein [Micrococcales bacterium]|nr:DUF3488 and transglutaminase-like domain-containing protein [Micrococcales bacterium]
MTGASGPLLVALAVLCSAWPVRDLFEESTWIPPLVLILLGIALTGTVLRRVPGLRGRPELVVGAQLFAYLAGLVAFFHGDTLAYGLPTADTVASWGALLNEAGQTLSRYPAPAPLTDGAQFLLVCTIGGIALVADIIAVSWHRPALSGVVILSPFLVAVANSDGGLHPGYFAATALSWLALLAGADREQVNAWAARGLPGVPPQGPAAGRSRTGMVTALAGSAVVLSLVGATFLPHVPVRYLADGLGVGGSGGRGQVGFSPSAQMIQDLQSTDESPVLRYLTDDTTPPPLRVSVALAYADGHWLPAHNDARPNDAPSLSFPVGWQRAQVPASSHRFEVEDNRLRAPYLAAPPEVSEGSVIDAQWAQDPATGALAVDKTPERYRMSYLELEPAPARLRAPQARSRSLQDALRPDGVTTFVAQTARRIVLDARADTAYDQALAIQEWLRSSGDFTYSLQLTPPPADMPEQEVAGSAVDRFLETKRGYCVQFSTAMALMARSLDIPARIATGFLPGTQVDGWRQVRASDAHAWPELYFEGAGWLRFEPTPGARSGMAPAYSLIRSSTGAPTSTANPGVSATPTPSASASPRRPGIDEGAGAAPPNPVGWFSRWGWSVLALLAALLLAGVVPLLAYRARRARVAALPVPGDRIEAHWQELLDRLADLDVDIDPALELAAQVKVIREAGPLHGPVVQALERLGRAVESARYAPEPTAPAAQAQVAIDAHLVLAAMSRARRRPVRLRAALWPAAGTRSLRRSLDRPVARLRALTSARARRFDADDRSTPSPRP